MRNTSLPIMVITRLFSWLLAVGHFHLATAAAGHALAPIEHGSNIITFPLIPHHVQRRRRRGMETTNDDDPLQDRSRYLKTSEVGALYHGYGTHYMDLWCGSPPQRQTVIVDTGSGVTAFPCKGCDDCGVPDYHIDDLFDPQSSTTFQKASCGQCSSRARCNQPSLECRIGMSYQEGSSWSAYEAIDTCYVGGYHNTYVVDHGGENSSIDPSQASAFGFPLQFGCQTKITGLFKTQLADGIMGMENAQSSFWHQMYNAGKIDNKSFALCFSRPEDAAREGTEAGAMTLGGAETSLHKTPMVYSTTKGTSSADGFFSVHVRAVYLRDGKDGDSAMPNNPSYNVINLNRPESALNAGGVIVDSGTTDTYWNSMIRQALRETFEELSGMPFGHDKVKLTEEELHALPTILFQLNGDENMNKQVAEANGGDPNKVPGLAGTTLDPEHPYDVILAVPASHYMEGEKGIYVNRFYDTEGGGSVLGANSIMGHDVLFDADNGRIGWAESDCDYSAMLQQNGYSDVMSGGEVEPVPQPNEDEQQQQAEAKEEKATDAPTDSPTEKTKDEEPLDTEDDTDDDDAVDGEDEDPSANDKKEKPGEGNEDIHESENPVNDIQKAIAENCTGLVCGGGLAVTLLLMCLFCVCCYRCCCKKTQPKIPPSAYNEVEMSMNNGPSYKDEFNDEEGDDEDAEYGVVIQSSYKDT